VLGGFLRMERLPLAPRVECMADDGHRGVRQKVLVAGAGIAGIEAALALRDLAGERVEVTLCDPRREFVFRPFAVAEPYGSARAFRYDLRRLVERCGASYLPTGIVAVDPEQRIAVSRDGAGLPYDHLIVAPGVRMLWAVPGATTFWGVADEGEVGQVVAELRAGGLRHLVFTMPGGRSWALPLYELALLAVNERGPGLRAGPTRITIVTPEDAPLEVFGRRAAEQMRELLAEREIGLVTGAHPVKLEGGRLQVAPGEEIEADAVISLPRLEGRRIEGVPHDDDGFIGVDEHLRVLSLDGAYAVGDATAFPIKQGGLAAQQADAAAEAIAAAAGAPLDPHPFDPVLRAVLWTGGEPRYLYGRPTGGHGETSGISEQPTGPLHNGKVTARYLTPFIEALSAETGAAAAGATVAAQPSSTS
jgi:sulfide:quinone oxidoreductase